MVNERKSVYGIPLSQLGHSRHCNTLKDDYQSLEQGRWHIYCRFKAFGASETPSESG